MPVELPDPTTNAPPKNKIKSIAIYAGSALLILGGLAYTVAALSGGRTGDQPEYLQCQQPPIIEPAYNELNLYNSSYFLTPEYQKKSVELLAGAIRIPTVTYDDMSFDVEHEKRFKVFKKLHKYLAQNFPRLYSHVEHVNTYGLLYTIKGSNPDLKPLVLMAHQDVVPVAPETRGDWEEDPFGGVFDGEWIHGRGSSDTKNSLIAIHEAAESLLNQHWQPERTVLLSFGFDEEIQGFRGARKLAEHIEATYGRDSVEFLIDEGFGFTEEYGTFFASPAVAEKGRVNFKVTLQTPGGHSSIPPDHTGIGILSEFIVRLEDQVPFTPELRSDIDAVRARFSCIGHYGEDVPSRLRDVFTGLGAAGPDKQLVDMLASDITSRILVETTQAIDLIHGGVKINALPEESVMEVNYRIKPASSVSKETEWFLEQVKELAHDFGLSAAYKDTFGGWNSSESLVTGSTDASATKGSLLIEKTDALDVAPMSPFHNSTHWDLISGTAKHVIEDVASSEFGDNLLVMTPGLMTGNTDTAHYWNLTDKIYRFNLVKMDTDTRNIHTVNEGLRARSHFACVAFFYELLINSQREL